MRIPRLVISGECLHKKERKNELKQKRRKKRKKGREREKGVSLAASLKTLLSIKEKGKRSENTNENNLHRPSLQIKEQRRLNMFKEMEG